MYNPYLRHKRYCSYFFFVGLIHANHGLKVMDYLANELRSNTSEVRVKSTVAV